MKPGLCAAMIAAAMLGGCANLLDWDNTSDAPGQSELDEDAFQACDETPNTDEARECRRRIQDSWRGEKKPGPLELAQQAPR
jgi:hypothetical protein